MKIVWQKKNSQKEFFSELKMWHKIGSDVNCPACQPPQKVFKIQNLKNATKCQIISIQSECSIPPKNGVMCDIGPIQRRRRNKIVSKMHAAEKSVHYKGLIMSQSHVGQICWNTLQDSKTCNFIYLLHCYCYIISYRDLGLCYKASTYM